MTRRVLENIWEKLIWHRGLAPMVARVLGSHIPLMLMRHLANLCLPVAGGVLALG